MVEGRGMMVGKGKGAICPFLNRATGRHFANPYRRHRNPLPKSEPVYVLVENTLSTFTL